MDNSNDSSQKWYIRWVKSDFAVIVVCLLAVLACVYTIYTVQAYQEAVNKLWLKQWEMSGCGYQPEIPNLEFNIGGSYHEIAD